MVTQRKDYERNKRFWCKSINHFNKVIKRSYLNLNFAGSRQSWKNQLDYPGSIPERRGHLQFDYQNRSRWSVEQLSSVGERHIAKRDIRFRNREWSGTDQTVDTVAIKRPNSHRGWQCSFELRDYWTTRTGSEYIFMNTIYKKTNTNNNNSNS